MNSGTLAAISAFLANPIDQHRKKIMKSLDSHTKSIQEQFNRQANQYAQTKQAKDVQAMAGLVRLTKTDRTLSLIHLSEPTRQAEN